MLFTPKAQSATVLDIVGRNGERLSGERVTAVGSFNVLEISKTVDLSVTVVPVTYPFVNTTQYGQGTAERTVADFLVAWRDKDYRRMASLMSISSRSTGLADADFIESLYELKSLKGAEIVNVTPAGASTTEITVNVWYEVRTNIVQKKRIIMRTVKESTTGQAVPRTSSGGSWGIVPLSLREIEAP